MEVLKGVQIHSLMFFHGARLVTHVRFARLARNGHLYNFSKALSEDGNFSNTGLVVNAKGGTNINQWVPGAHFYQEAVRRGTIAAGTNGKVIATFWLQGESNLGDDDPECKISQVRKYSSGFFSNVDKCKNGVQIKEYMLHFKVFCFISF